jgi:hypothetical protein
MEKYYIYKETKKGTQINDKIFDTVVKFHTQQLAQQVILPKQQSTFFFKLVQGQPLASRHPPQQETRQMHASHNKTPHRGTIRSSKLNELLIRTYSTSLGIYAHINTHTSHIYLYYRHATGGRSTNYQHIRKF